jgi:GNAT superfamily N-acetyltransferase
MLDYMVSRYQSLPVSPHRLRGWLIEWLTQQQAWCRDARFSAAFPWRETGLPQRYFLQRELHIDGQRYLTGPRYLGGDPDQPFIDIVALDGPINHQIACAIMQAWQPLHPHYLRVLLPADHLAIGIPDQLIFLSHPDSLSGITRPDVSLLPATRKDYPRCLTTINRAYRASWRALPAIRHQLLATDKRELAEDIAQGNVFLIICRGVQVGLIICAKRRVGFIEGFQILDEVISPAYRGQGLAAHAQQLLLRQLYHRYGDTALLSGAILPGNAPSLRSAEKAQRRCVLKYHFFTPEDLQAGQQILSDEDGK